MAVDRRRRQKGRKQGLDAQVYEAVLTRASTLCPLLDSDGVDGKALENARRRAIGEVFLETALGLPVKDGASLAELGGAYQQLAGSRLEVRDGEARLCVSSDRRKASGSFFTPYTLVEDAVRRALELVQRGKPVRVLDPACGAGHFLLGAAEALAAGGWDRRRIAREMLYGMDSDPAAVEVARALLWVWASEPAGHPGEMEKIRCGDALEDGAFDEAGKFDAVVSNPPWVSYSGRQARPMDGRTRDQMASRFRAFRGWRASHSLFTELAVRLTREGGRAAIVAPEQMAHLGGYEALRRAVSEEADVEAALPLGEQAFPGVTGPAALYVFRKRRSFPEAAMPRWNLKASETRGLAGGILDKMGSFPPLGPEAFRDTGVHTGNSAALLLRDEGESSEDLAPLREGRCVTRFHLSPATRRLALDAARQSEYGSYFRIASRDTYFSARILIRQTAARPIAAVHIQPAYFRNSILACYGVPGTPDFYLLALLNSRALAFFHRHNTPDSRQRAFPQMKIRHLRALPFPPFPKATPTSEEAAWLREWATGERPEPESVPQHLLAHAASACAERLSDEARTAEDSGAVDLALDALVYRLYGLSGEQRALIASEFIPAV